jgi:hypothetical protein
MSGQKPIPVYEDLLRGPFDDALREASTHFEQQSAVHITLYRIVRELDRFNTPYAVAGAMAMFQLGYRRFTEVVELLVTAEGLAEIHRQLEGAGYLPPFTGSKQLRDTDTGVRIEFLVAGQFPGDGKPKPVVFPDPTIANFERDGIRFLPLKDLIQLKLASGMSNPGRLKDLADVQEMIRELKLPSDFANQLDASVREQFNTLWNGVHSSPQNQ